MSAVILERIEGFCTSHQAQESPQVKYEATHGFHEGLLQS